MSMFEIIIRRGQVRGSGAGKAPLQTVNGYGVFETFDLRSEIGYETWEMSLGIVKPLRPNQHRYGLATSPFISHYESMIAPKP